MARYVYIPTGAQVTAGDGSKLPPDLFKPVDEKPKPKPRASAKTAKPKG